MSLRRFKPSTRSSLLLLLLLAVSFVCGACSTTEPDNESIKPWDSPEGWQNGNLQMMQQQQH